MFEEYKNDFVSTCKDGSRLVAAKEKWILKQREECSKISPSGIKHTKHDKVLTASLKMEIFIQLLELTDSKNKGIYECNDQLLEVEEFTQVIDNHKKLYVYDYENRLQPFRDSLSFLCKESKELKQNLYRVRLLSNPEKLYLDLKFPDSNEIEKIKELVNIVLKEYKLLWQETLVSPEKELEIKKYNAIGERIVKGGQKGGRNNGQKKFKMEQCYELYDELMSKYEKLPEAEIKKVIAKKLKRNVRSINRYLLERTNKTK